jgi:hypothetical protein
VRLVWSMDQWWPASNWYQFYRWPSHLIKYSRRLYDSFNQTRMSGEKTLLTYFSKVKLNLHLTYYFNTYQFNTGVNFYSKFKPSLRWTLTFAFFLFLQKIPYWFFFHLLSNLWWFLAQGSGCQSSLLKEREPIRHFISDRFWTCWNV